MTMELALHATPRWRDVLIAQIRAVGSALRWPAVTAAALLGVVTLLVIPRLLSDASINFRPEQLLLFGLVGLLFPIGVWKGQERFRNGFMWTLPVERRQHALSRVCAGWVWLMASVALFVAWLLALALLSGENPLAAETLLVLPGHAGSGLAPFPFPAAGTLERQALRTIVWTPEPLLWLTPFAAATGTYLLASAATLGLRHPLRWIIATVLGLLLLEAIAEAADMRWLMQAPHRMVRQAFIGPYGFDTLLTARTEFHKIGTTLSTGENVVIWRGLPDVRQWAVATALWLIAGLAVLWAAASRHLEHRRI